MWWIQKMSKFHLPEITDCRQYGKVIWCFCTTSLQRQQFLRYACTYFKSYYYLLIFPMWSYHSKTPQMSIFRQSLVLTAFEAFLLKCHQKILVILCHSLEDSWTTSSKFRAWLMSSSSCPWWLVDSCTVPTIMCNRNNDKNHIYHK